MQHSTTQQPHGFWRRPKVEEFVGLPTTTLYRYIRTNRFPRPVRTGPNTVGWRVEEVMAWARDPAGWAAR